MLLIKPFKKPFRFFRTPAWSVVARVLLALFGAYVLANLAAIALSLLLPTTRADAVMTGMLLSYIFWVAAAIWVFSTASIWRVFLGMVLVCMVLGIFIGLMLAVGRV